MQLDFGELRDVALRGAPSPWRPENVCDLMCVNTSRRSSRESPEWGGERGREGATLSPSKNKHTHSQNVRSTTQTTVVLRGYCFSSAVLLIKEQVAQQQEEREQHKLKKITHTHTHTQWTPTHTPKTNTLTHTCTSTPPHTHRSHTHQPPTYTQTHTQSTTNTPTHRQSRTKARTQTTTNTHTHTYTH